MSVDYDIRLSDGGSAVQVLKNNLMGLKMNTGRKGSLLTRVLKKMGIEESEGYEQRKAARNRAIELIHDFLVPENGEEMLEFMKLADEMIDPVNNHYTDKLFVTWEKKMKETCESAEKVLGNDSCLEQIRSIYQRLQRFIRLKKILRYKYPVLQLIILVFACISVREMPYAVIFQGIFCMMSGVTFYPYIALGGSSHE